MKGIIILPATATTTAAAHVCRCFYVSMLSTRIPPIYQFLSLFFFSFTENMLID